MKFGILQDGFVIRAENGCDKHYLSFFRDNEVKATYDTIIDRIYVTFCKNPSISSTVKEIKLIRKYDIEFSEFCVREPAEGEGFEIEFTEHGFMCSTYRFGKNKAIITLFLKQFKESCILTCYDCDRLLIKAGE